MPRVTLQTIADEIGVSRTTVSNAFSRPDQLSDDLRQQIMDAARRLGYTGPDPAAQRLRRGEAGVVGVVLRESLAYAFSDPYALLFLGGLATPVEAAGLGLLLIPCPPGDDQAAGVRRADVDRFAVFSLPDEHPMVAAVLERKLPTVFVDGPMVPDKPFVGIDDRRAMAEMAQLVVAEGHQRVAVLTFRIASDDRTGPADDTRLAMAEYRITRERLHGAVDTLRAGGLDPLVWEVGLNAREGARNAARQMLERQPRPTAVLCLSDQIALGVMDTASELGIDIPGELTVTGFDDIPESLPAGLTTISQPAVSKGAAAWRLLETKTTGHETLSHRLVKRQTTARETSGG